MFAYIFQNRGERADPYGIVIWNGDVMNAVFRGCQPYVASGLAGHFITQRPKGFYQIGA
jgi:hypothetical protein